MTTRTASGSLALLLLASCATAKPVAIPSDDLGLQKGPVMAVATPPKLVVNETAPGEAKLYVKSWVGTAPVVPHAVGDFLPITARENACVGCHEVATREKGGPTPIPTSHHVDYRNAPDKVQEKVVSARWVCVNCHVEGTKAPPLVRSDFRP
jgi:nitrate reductase cytochrome c-type subunit